VSDQGSSEGVQSEAAFGFLPALKKDRIFGWFDFTLVQTGFGIAAWCFLVGGLTGVTVEGKYAIWVILLGNAIPVLLCLPFALQTARLGVDTFIASNMSLGYAFSKVFFTVFAVLNLGWIAIANFMLGQAAAKICEVFGLPAFFSTRTTGAPFWSIVFIIVALYITYLGPVAIRFLARVGVPAVLAILIWLIIAVVFKYGFHFVWSSEPVSPYTTAAGGVDFRRSIVTALEWNVGLGFSWLVYLGQWCRLAKSESGSINGSYLGLGLILNIAGIFGAFTALSVGNLDPPNWMIPTGGNVLGVLGLLLLVAANLFACTHLTYSQALSVKSVISPKANWTLCIATCLPAIALVVTPGFYDHYQRFLVAIAYLTAVFGGILVADWLLVHRKRAELGALYDHKNPQYRYWRGWNPTAVLAFVGGTASYWIIYNPWTDTPGVGFLGLALGAGIPTFFIAGILYVALAKTVFRSLYEVDRAWQDVMDRGEFAVMLPHDLAAELPAYATADPAGCEASDIAPFSRPLEVEA
jgi:nucleobase:cation symporter-1, NCS1 family